MAVNAVAPSACRAVVPYVQRTQPMAAWRGPVDAAALDLVVTPHPLTLQGQTVARAAELRPGETLASFLARHGVDVQQPGWCIRVGGLEVPAHLCDRTRVRPGWLVEAHRVPGKSVLRLIALVALAYFVFPGGFFKEGLGAIFAKGFFAYALNAGAFMLGSAIINKLLPPPGVGSYGANGAGTTYSLQGARNGARQFGPLGLLFGQVRVVPDFAALPYAWFEGDDQFQYVQLHAGLNCHTVEALQIGETAIESYSDVVVSRTGFASGNTTMLAWESVDTVAGGLLDAPSGTGSWVVRTSSANTVRLQVDMVGDLHYINSKGNPQRFPCTVEMEHRLLPSGSWAPLVGGSSAVELANATTKPLRRTITKDVAAGQYEVRMRKITKNESRNQAANVIEWNSLKSFQADTGTAVARQVVGIRIRASGQLNGTLDQVSWLATSTPCPVWTGSAWVTQTTSNPGALILQFARGVFDGARLLWGYGKTDAEIDIEGLKAFMVHCDAQGYRFDHWFTEAVSRRAVLEAIAAAGMASISRHTGKLGVVYMAAGQAIEAVVNMGNIKRGSFRVDYATRSTAEEVEVASPERTNSWRPATLRVLAPGVTVPRETARISPAGITTQAGRLLAARSLMAQNIYGRKGVQWEMDLEHLTVRRWSLVALSHDLTQWGYGGRLHSLTDTAGTITIELDAEVPAGSTPHVGLRLPGETAYRVFAVAPFSGTVHTLTLATSWPSGVTKPGSSADNPAMDTLWVFDFKATPGQRLRITDIAPTADMSGARITAVPEPDEFWDFIASGAYTAPAGTASSQPIVLSDLQVTQERLALSYDLTAELAVTWTASGAYDHAQVWGAADDDKLQLLGQSRTTRFTGWRVLNAGTVHVEVRPFDALGRPGPVLAGTHTVVLEEPLAVQGNLLPVSELVAGLSTSVGSTLVGRWYCNALTATPAGPVNELVQDVGPDGLPAVVWRATSGTGGFGQGGWDRLPGDPIDPTRPYRFAVWVRSSGHTSGDTYLGCSGVRDIGGSENVNPYFIYRARSAFVPGRWYLWVGYVYPHDYSGPQPYQSGVWDGVTGERVQTGGDFQWMADAIDCRWRTYQYYTTAAGAVQDWAWPMVHLADGTEPSVSSMLAAASAGAAKAAADVANTAIAVIVNDGILSRDEKPGEVLRKTVLDNEWAGIDASASALGVTTERAAYTSALSALGSYLDGLTPDWDDATQNTTITRATYTATWAAVYTARQVLLNKIAAVAATNATWGGVSGSGKPADNATRNVVTYSGSAPGSPVDGDLWVDTAGAYAVFKLRSGGAWVTGANALSAYNALSGTPVALADINTTESAKLAGIAAGATVNRLAYGPTAPGGPVDGDVWVDTSATPSVIKLRVSGAWQTGANLSTGALAQLNSVDTAEIAAGAVIDAAVVSVASFTATDAGDGHSPDGEGWREAIISMTYTPTVACKVLLQCTGLWDYTTAAAGIGMLGLQGGINIAGAWSAANDSFEHYENIGVSTNRRGFLSAISVFALSAGTSYTFKVLMRYQTVALGDVINFSSLNFSRTVYKR